MIVSHQQKQVKATSEQKFGVMYFVKAAAAGGICCSVTHGAVTPMDVVKTRIQLDPIKYNKGFIGTFRQVISTEGAGALLTGLGATATGYFVQGWVSPRFVPTLFFIGRPPMSQALLRSRTLLNMNMVTNFVLPSCNVIPP